MRKFIPCQELKHSPLKPKPSVLKKIFNIFFIIGLSSLLRLHFLFTVYPCTQSSQCQPSQSTPQGSMGMQSEGNSKCPLNLDDLPSGPGPWYIPLDSQTTSASENGHLLSLDGSSFHLHCPTTFIGTTSTTTTFLPLNGKNKFIN